MSGQLDLRTALFVLVLAPEAYLPLRRLGASYHASAEGMAAAEQVFAVLPRSGTLHDGVQASEKPLATGGTRIDVPDPATLGLTVEGVRITYAGRGAPALDDVSLSIEPGETTALAGPSGCGKSSLLSVLLGFLAPERGTVRVGEVDLAELDLDAWRSQIAWVPQRPHLFASTIAENVRIGCRGASKEEILGACSRVGLDELVARLPAGVDTVLGEGGAGLSAGERQRIALARAFLRDAPLLLLDEPTANLDGETEEQIVESVRDLCQGRTVVLVAHRPALLDIADRVLTLGALEAVA
jgi:ABC-type transport system involved in cytochrome bd biosynthesis fused ATPase/permease subunit